MERFSTIEKRRPTAEEGWPPPQGEWTYEDWLKLPDDGYRYEVIDGVLHMSPPPRPRHQRVAFRLARKLADFVEDHQLGEVFVAPVGVELPNQSVPLQPDVLFIQAGRLGIVGEDSVEGAPDLIMEVLSPSNWLYDRRDKKEVYEEVGVPEYWIVDPRMGTIEVHVLEDNVYRLVNEYGAGGAAQSHVISGFEVPIDEVFREVKE